VTRVKLGVYEHFKGGRYEVLGVAKHSETLEDLVVYKSLYANKVFKLWARPIAVFLSKKELNGQKIQRFKYIGPTQG